MSGRDVIAVSELEVHFRVGVPDEERRHPQRLLLSVEMETDFTAAAASDDLARTVNYYEVVQRLRGLGHGREWKLIETLAVEVASLILQEFGVARVRVEVRKFILPGTRHVSVRVERTRHGETASGGD